jgi:kumamolisin
VVTALVSSLSAPAAAQRPPGRAGATTSATTALPPLSVAVRQAQDLGAMQRTAPITFTVALGVRNGASLQSTLDRGDTVTPVQWAASFGPAAADVAAMRAVLGRAGLATSWSPGEQLLTVAGPAASVERFLHIRLDRFLLGDTRFYAPLRPPALPRALGPQVVAVTGLDDYPGAVVATIPKGQIGLSPADITRFYDLSPLRAAGFDGTGMTVIFPEYAMPAASVLAAYATKFGLPPFNVTVHTDPSAWGAPGPATGELAGEAAMDLEIVHGLAPGAKEIVYAGGDSNLPNMFQTMFEQNPGAVMSSSITGGGWCEADPASRSFSVAANTVFEQAAAEGFSIYWASGDRGAYACVQDGSPGSQGELSIWTGSDSPFVTAVGGTTVFPASDGAYYKEAAWGEPLESWGSGGGTSAFFAQPSYQVAPGLAAHSLSGRGTPDVACNADGVSGWDIYYPAQQGPVEVPDGGTSAATPCWAAITALIDEDLKSQGLHEVGFANPALYYFAGYPAGMPATPFHEVTVGSNLHFAATAGWNSAVGLGTPDGAHLADDFEWYERTK